MILNPEIFKAYDIRGRYPEDFDHDAARRIGEAYAATLTPQAVAVGYDVRTASPALAAALTEGLLHSGVDVVDLGLITTDMLYFAVGSGELDGGIVVTASHNPTSQDGFKFVGPGARAISGEDGLDRLRDWALSSELPQIAPSGKLTTEHVGKAYIDHILSFIDPSRISPTRVALGDPSEPLRKNLELLRESIPVEVGEASDGALTVNWDLDADRCRFQGVDGREISGCFITALLAEKLLRAHPGEKIIHDPRLVWAIQEAVTSSGGTAIETRAGHSFIKARMRSEDALFAGEVSGHYYFRDNFYADNGLIPFLLILELLSESGKTLSELLDPWTSRFFVSSEHNYEVPDPEAIIERVQAHFPGAAADRTDGLGLSFETWRFNLRPSNTESLLRLNLESRASQAEVDAKLAEVEELIRG